MKMKTSLAILTAMFLSGFLPAIAEAQNSEANSLLVLSKQDHTLAIVDPISMKVTARVPVGNDPHEVIASTDGKTAYVSNYGGGAFNTLAVVDLVDHKALPAIDLGPLRGPHGLTFAGGKTWFTAEAAKAIASYDPATRKVDWIMGTGQNRTHMIFVSQDQKQIITTNVNSGTVTILDQIMRRPPPSGPPPGTPASTPPPGPMQPIIDWDETVIKVGNGSEGFDVSPDLREIWVANAQDGTVSIIDVASKKVTETVPADVRGANRLKFTVDGKRVLIATLKAPGLVVLDAVSHHDVKRIAIGHGAAGILMQPDGARAFVACTPDGYVAVIDLQTLEVTGHIDAGGGPDGMAWAVRR